MAFRWLKIFLLFLFSASFFQLGRKFDSIFYFDDSELIEKNIGNKSIDALSNNLTRVDKGGFRGQLVNMKKDYFRTSKFSCIRYMPKKQDYTSVYVYCMHQDGSNFTDSY